MTTGKDQKIRLDRRQFMGTMTAVVARLGLGGLVFGCGDDPLEPSLDEVPVSPPVPEGVFKLGVASGDPLHDRVVLWTRLASEPLEEGGMPDEDVPVIWEVFADEALEERVAHGWAWAVPELAHCVHVDVAGLEPSRFYWYRFRIGDAQHSPVGRTRTFPAPDDRPERLRIVLACCQKYRDGYYSAHEHIASLDLDVVVFLGDYIYESGGVSTVPGRLPIDTELVGDLRGFRARYGAYRMDPSLQKSHAAHPWIITWDDHEVSNNYADFEFTEARENQGVPAEVRAAGYQAWYEHMPVRIASFDDPSFMKIYRHFDYGDLARICVLDTRQYRDPQPCGDETGRACAELLAGGLSILGEEQRQWLSETLPDSNRRWSLIAQQVLFSPALMEFGIANPDQWDGYIDDRQAVLDLMADPSVSNPMVLSGDVHAAGFAELYADQFDPSSPRIAIEVLATSISSGGDEADELARAAQALERASKSLHYVDALKRGFTLCEYTQSGCEVTYYAVTTVSTPQADLYTAARFAIEADSLDFEFIERA